MVDQIAYEPQGNKATLLLRVGSTFIEITAIKNPDKVVEIDWTTYTENEARLNSADC